MSEAQLKAAEAEIEAQKREWEANRLAALQKEEEMLQREAEKSSPEELITYSRRDANNQVVNKSKQKEQASNIRKNTNLSRCFANRNRDSKLNVKRRGGIVNSTKTTTTNQSQRIVKSRVINNRKKLSLRNRNRNKQILNRQRNDLEQQESSEENDDDDEDEEEEKEAEEEEIIEKYSTRSTTSLDKELQPIIMKSKTGVKNQKLLNIARLKQNESKVIKLPTRRLAVVLTKTQRVLRNNTVRQSVNKNRIEEKNSRTKNNINTQIVNFRNKLRSESCRSSENTEEDDDEKSADETDIDECNGIIQEQENTNSSTTYYNVSEEESEDESESEESDKQSNNTKLVTKQILKSPNIESETTPRTRSRGTVNIDLWTLDNSLLNTSCHSNVSRSSKKDNNTNQQNNVETMNITANNCIDKKSKVYLKRRKPEDFESSKPAKLTTLEHWVTTTTKNGSPNTYHETES